MGSRTGCRNSERPEPRSRVSTPRLVGLAVALLALTAFIAENFERVEVRLFVTERQTRLAWALLIARRSASSQECS